MKNAPTTNSSESVPNKRDYTPGTLPIRRNTVMAAVLAGLLESKVITSVDSVIAQSAPPLTTVIRTLEKRYNWKIERRDVATGKNDGRIECDTAYLLPEETITQAHEMGVQSWIDDVHAAHGKIKQQTNKKKASRNQPREQDPRQRDLWGELSLARIESVSPIRAADHHRAISPNYGTYEQCKMQWDSQHPEATPAQRDAAMIRIARECGV